MGINYGIFYWEYLHCFSWSGYFTNLLETFGIHLPDWLTINYQSAHAAFLDNKAGEGLAAWNGAPMLGSLKIIFDLPAVLIIC